MKNLKYIEFGHKKSNVLTNVQTFSSKTDSLSSKFDENYLLFSDLDIRTLKTLIFKSIRYFSISKKIIFCIKNLNLNFHLYPPI